MMGKMKAYVRTSAKNMEVELQEVPIPVFNADEVLIKVEAFGVGIHDRYFIPANAAFPYIIGTEGAGIIIETGADAIEYVTVDRVLFPTTLQPQGGCWSEYAVAKKSALIPLPANLSFVQGAALTIAGKTALECMRDLNLKEGDNLFIAGASGAIGTFVIQLATLKGIRVAGSASLKNQEYMQSLGADKTVDYNDPDWKQKVREWSGDGVNAALAIQPGTGIDSIDVVKDSGKLVTVSGDHNGVTPERNITVSQMQHGDTKQQFEDLVQSIADGKIKLEIEHEYPFEQALDALRKTETRHARGKLVVRGYVN